LIGAMLVYIAKNRISNATLFNTLLYIALWFFFLPLFSQIARYCFENIVITIVSPYIQSQLPV